MSVGAIVNRWLALSWTSKRENLALCQPYSSASYLAPFILHISTFMMKQRGSEDERSAETTITPFFVFYTDREAAFQVLLALQREYLCCWGHLVTRA
jgi:hypothetical protein